MYLRLEGGVGVAGGAMVLGKLPVRLPGRPANLVGCFGLNGSLRQYFSLYRAVSQREGERGERTDVSKNVQTTPTRTYCKRNRPLPYCYQNCRTPWHWKFTHHHRTTRPPPANLDYSRARAYCACSKCGWVLFDIFFSSIILSSFSLTLGDCPI